MLKNLERELERGEVDEKLLDELGWSNQEMRNFTERLKRQLHKEKSVSETPQETALRRQFEEMLKSLDLHSAGKKREGSRIRKRTADTIGPRRGPVPAEYRDDFEAYTRGRSRRTDKSK